MAAGADGAQARPDPRAHPTQSFRTCHTPRRRAAARLFVDTFVKDGQTLGLGTGELASLVIEEVARRCLAGQLNNIQGVPASDAAATEAAFQGLPLHPQASAQVHVDLAFDQADQLDVQSSACLLGGEVQRAGPHATPVRARTVAWLAGSADGCDRSALCLGTQWWRSRSSRSC